MASKSTTASTSRGPSTWLNGNVGRCYYVGNSWNDTINSARDSMFGKDVGGGYDYLGNAPAATGGVPGWTMRADLFARCIRCGGFVSLDPDEYGECHCGAIHKDRDAGRFGSSLGDDAIEIYRPNR